MDQTSKRVDVRVGEFAVSLQGFDDPAEPLGRILPLLQRAITETPALTGTNFVLDDEMVSALTEEALEAQPGDAGGADLVPGLVVLQREAGALPASSDDPAKGVSTAMVEPDEDAIETEDLAPASVFAAPVDDATAAYAPEDLTAAPEPKVEAEDPEAVEITLETDTPDDALPVFAESTLDHAEHDPLADGVDEALDAAAEAFDEAGLEIEITEDMEGNREVRFPRASDPHSAASDPDAEADDLVDPAEAHHSPLDDRAADVPTRGSPLEPPGLASEDPYIRELAERIARINANAAEAEAEFNDAADAQAAETSAETPLDETSMEDPADADETTPDETPSSIFAEPAEPRTTTLDPELAAVISQALGETGAGPAAEPDPDDDVLVLGDTGSSDAGTDNPAELRARLDAMVDRVVHGEGEAPEDEGLPAAFGETLEDFVRASGGTSTTELVLSTAGWLQMVQARDGFSRGEVMTLIDRIEGNHDRSIEAKVRAYSQLVQGGDLVGRPDGLFILSEHATSKLVEQFNQSA